MKANFQKGFAWIPILIIFLAACLIGAGAYYYINKIYLPKLLKLATKEVEEAAKKEKPKPEEKEIVWYEPQKIESLKIFWLKSRPEGGRYYKVGDVKKGKYINGEIILAFSRIEEGIAFSDDLYRFVRKDKKLYLLTKYSTKLYDNDGLDHSMFAVDDSFTISDLEFSETIDIPNSDEKLTLSKDEFNALFDKTGLLKLFSDSKYGDVYSNQSPGSAEAWYGPVKNNFFIKAPDSTVRVYGLSPKFMGEKCIPSITWLDGSKNSQEYAYKGILMCGAFFCLAVVDISEQDLVQIGTTPKGEKVYGYKDTNHSELKRFYDEEYVPSPEETKMSYSEFIKNHPIFFWKDPFGRFVKFKNKALSGAAEVAKPAIYLYPAKETIVNVKVNPAGGITISNPLYKNGWKVMAYPDGKIFDISTNKTYPYLFWEGKAYSYQTPKAGFVVKKADIHKFLDQKLHKLGLNDKETAQFIDFWEPKMQTSAYYFVTFLPQEQIDKMAPLFIEPKPDIVIRILMDYKPLDKYINVPALDIVTPFRRGFTVVEWGGVWH